jgi:hydroxymethylglutaryl-CoA reductase
MARTQVITGFSKLSRREKIVWLQKQAALSDKTVQLLDSHLHPDPGLQDIYGDISENTISNYFLPLGLAPNFLVNDNLITVPMVTEESSVVAAASHAAKFWALHDGFHSSVEETYKTGQVHFTWNGSDEKLKGVIREKRKELLHSVDTITGRMRQRGGGIEDLVLNKGGDELPGYYQLFVKFRTADAMGANFINSVLEILAGKLVSLVTDHIPAGDLEIIMSILSNYTPECLVTCHVEGKTDIFDSMDPGLSGGDFARKFKMATDIAAQDIHRAVTHNKGIFNGIDAVVLATGNDFRAVEAGGHAYASRNGTYRGLTHVDLTGKTFTLTLEVPVAVGTVGGLTGTHPLAAISLEILGNPSAEQLMHVVAAAGLANNFSAVRSLITTGIQKGHMKMHLGNILRQMNATPEERGKAISHFSDQQVSHSEVAAFLETIRNKNKQR